MHVWFLKRGSLLLLISLWLTGCGSDPGFNEETDFVRKDGAAQFVNLMPDSPELTVIHGINSFLAKFPFTSGIEQRFEDKYDWRIAYLNSDNREVTVAEAENQQISENVQSTFLLMGSLQQPDIQIVDIPIPLIEDRPIDKAELWFASNLSGPAMVDIYVTDFGSSISESAPLTSLNSRTYSQTFSVTAGQSRQLRITTAGTTELLFDSGEIVVTGQSLELIALVDDFGPNGSSHANVIRSTSVNGSIINDVSQASEARVANLSSIEPMDVTAATITYTDLSAGGRTDYRAIESGSQAITSTGPSGATGDETAFFSQGQFLTVVILDDPGADSQPATRAALIADDRRSLIDRAHFQFVNGNSEVIDFYALREDESTENTAPIFNDISDVSTDVLEVATGPVRFVVMDTGSTETRDSLEITLVEGNSYTIVYDGLGNMRLLEG